MTNEDLRRMIEDTCSDPEVTDSIVLLEGDEFAEAAIGLSDDWRVIYSYERMVKSLADTDPDSKIVDQVSFAVDWIDHNTIPTIALLNAHGMKAPIIMHEF